MKRTLALTASIVTLLSFTTPAFAYSTRSNDQKRIDRRAVQSAAHAAYLGRHNRTYVRARYNELVQSVAPLFLAVTGPRALRQTSTDYMKISRPGTRAIDDWVLGDHCVRTSRRCAKSQ